MKKTTLLLLALVLTTSCLQRADRHAMRTAYGASILFEGVSDVMQHGDFVLTAVEMDIVAAAPIEQRDSLSDKFFPYSKFRIIGKKYALIRDNQSYFVITPDGQSLTTPGAVCEITNYGRYDQIQPSITITCLTPNSWMLKTTRTFQGKSFEMKLASRRKKIDSSPREFQCEVTLDKAAIVDRSRMVLHSLTTASPLVVRYVLNDDHLYYGVYNYDYVRHYNYLYTGYRINDGSVADDFKNPTTNKIEKVDAQFGLSSLSTVVVDITYCGVTDTWHWDDIPSYGHNSYYR